MISIIFTILQVAMLISFFTFIPTMFGLRIYLVIKYKKDLKQSLLITLLPLSIGYYKLLEDDRKIKIYNYLLIIFSVITLIGSLFTIYQWIPPVFNP